MYFAICIAYCVEAEWLFARVRDFKPKGSWVESDIIQ